MSVSIIIETGAGLENSNSYVSIEDAKKFFINRGSDISNDDDIAVMLIRATDYLERLCYLGNKASPGQALAFPRADLVVNDTPIASNVIPGEIRKAQLFLAHAVSEGFDISGNSSHSDYVISEKVGPLTTQFADPTLIGVGVKLKNVDALLKDFICTDVYRLRTRRV